MAGEEIRNLPPTTLPPHRLCMLMLSFSGFSLNKGHNQETTSTSTYNEGRGCLIFVVPIKDSFSFVTVLL